MANESVGMIASVSTLVRKNNEKEATEAFLIVSTAVVTGIVQGWDFKRGIMPYNTAVEGHENSGNGGWGDAHRRMYREILKKSWSGMGERWLGG